MHKLISYQELMTIKITAPDFSSLAKLCLVNDNLSVSLQHNMQADVHILKCYRENASILKGELIKSFTLAPLGADRCMIIPPFLAVHPVQNTGSFGRGF